MTTRTFDKSNITLSAVVAAPAGWPLPVGNKDWTNGYLDLNATVKYGISLISEARNNGADLVAFPELWFPGEATSRPTYPKSLAAKWLFTRVEEYVQQSLVVDSDEWQALRDAARENEVFVSFGYSERAGDYIYMSQALFGPDGKVLINRRKLGPSGTERGLWSDGDPSMTFNIQAQMPNIHVGPWPYNENPGADVENWEGTQVAYSTLNLMSIMTNAVAVTPSVGHGFITQFTTHLATSDSNETASPTDDQGYAPIIYTSVNGSSWSNQSCNLDGEVSWGTLMQIEDGFPEYIPKEIGDFVPSRQYPIDRIVADLRSGNASESVVPFAIFNTSATETSSLPAASSSVVASSAMAGVVCAPLQLAAFAAAVVYTWW